MTSAVLAMIESDLESEGAAALRRRMQVEGYLLLRGLLPADALLALRREITCILARHGWIEDGANRSEARVAIPPVREGEAALGFFAVHDEIMKLESFYALAHLPALTKLMEAVFASPAFPHPLSICRLAWPDNDLATTPPHQDYPNNQGTKRLTASWIPLGDCPQDAGGLAILRGSNRSGKILDLAFHLGPGNRQAVLPDDFQQLPWVSTDYRVGDVLLFPSTTVHRALPNESDRMRLSVDYRFQPEGEELTDLVLEPHFGRLSWEEIYSGWESTRYQYYWKNISYQCVPWSGRYHQLPDEALPEALRVQHQYDRKRFGGTTPAATTTRATTKEEQAARDAGREGLGPRQSHKSDS